MIKLKLLRFLSSILQKITPRMVIGFKRYDGVFLEQTRISNSTFIDNVQNFKVEDNVFIGHNNFLEASNGLTIEEGCQITNFITITTHSSHNSIRLYGKNYGGSDMVGYQKGEVFIGKYSFIGPHVTIMPNTKIGKGSIVSSHSYVRGEFPDYSIISGNPAKVIGDTRTKDLEIIRKHPELKKNYDEWTNS
jgi:acetyltransferase-like isoleucine patch superfamily enzyme